MIRVQPEGVHGRFRQPRGTGRTTASMAATGAFDRSVLRLGDLRSRVQQDHLASRGGRVLL